MLTLCRLQFLREAGREPAAVAERIGSAESKYFDDNDAVIMAVALNVVLRVWHTPPPPRFRLPPLLLLSRCVQIYGRDEADIARCRDQKVHEGKLSGPIAPRDDVPARHHNIVISVLHRGDHYDALIPLMNDLSVDSEWLSKIAAERCRFWTRIGLSATALFCLHLCTGASDHMIHCCPLRLEVDAMEDEERYGSLCSWRQLLRRPATPRQPQQAVPGAIAGAAVVPGHVVISPASVGYAHPLCLLL